MSLFIDSEKKVFNVPLEFSRSDTGLFQETSLGSFSFLKIQNMFTSDFIDLEKYSKYLPHGFVTRSKNFCLELDLD